MNQNIKPVVLIFGYTGAGKTTILQSIFGKNNVADDKISHGEPKTQNFDIYESSVIKIYDSKGLEPDKGEDNFIASVKDFIAEKENSPDFKNHINVYWYVIQGSGGRVTKTDLKIIKSLKPESTIVIISKSDITKLNQFSDIERALLKNGISKERIIATRENQEGEYMNASILNLYNLTREILPEGAKAAWDKTQSKEKKSLATILTATTAASVAAIIPIPFASSIPITAIQATMLVTLAGIYDIGITKEQVLPILGTFIGQNLTRQFASNLLKFIPGFGSVAGGVLNASVAGSLTAGIGFYARDRFKNIAHAKANGKQTQEILDFNINDVVKFMKENKKALNSFIKNKDK